MATVVVPLKLRDADATPTITFPTTQLAFTNGGGVVGSSFPVQVGIFPDSIVSGAAWTVTPNVVGTPAMTVVIDWFSPTVTTGNVFWSVNVSAVAANAVVLNKALSTANTATTAVSGTLGGRVRTSVTVSNNDGFAAAVQPLFVRITRDGTNAADTAVSDIWVFGMNVNFSDT